MLRVNVDTVRIGGWFDLKHVTSVAGPRPVQLPLLPQCRDTSLVPRPSHCPVFDRLQDAKTEGEGLVSFITWMTSVSTRVDRGGEGFLIERGHFTHTFFVLNQERHAFRFANVRNSSAWGRNYKTRHLAHSFDRWPLPPSVYLGGTDIIHMINDTRPSPSVFAYCKQSKTGQWEGLGTRL